MKKLIKASKGLFQIINKPYLLNLVLDEEKNWEKKVIKEFGCHDGLPVVNITDLLSEDFNIEISPYAFLDGSSLPSDLALLRGIAEKRKIKNYLEIGTWRGESVANIAAVAKNCITLSLPDEHLRKKGLSEDYIKSHRLFSEHLENVKHIQCDSRDFDFSSLKDDFDMIFIDGDHHSEAVKSDTQKIFEFIDPEKTIVVWHDYASNPEKIRWSVLYGILSGCPDKYHKNIVHVSNTLCAVYFPEIEKYGLIKRKLIPDTKPDFYFKMKIEPVKLNFKA